MIEPVYISTRGDAPALAFDDALLSGPARDGGLYVPDLWPRFSRDDIRRWRDLTYAEIAVEVMTPFVGAAIDREAFAAMVADTYAGFDHPDVAPLTPLGDGCYLLELFHGPTLAFKDYALQLVGRLFDHVLTARGAHITIVGATSGDTGSAAIAGCAGREAMDIFILHPKGRTSEVQRRQMTTIHDANVFNIAVDGTFDDCQDLVKALFADEPFRRRLHLSAVNSINWARVMGQIVYYMYAASRLGGHEGAMAFAVPTGNFGNVYAGYAARASGLPVSQLIVGSNRNDILTRFFETERMEIRNVEPSLSPSMDIQVSSNFERLLFDLYDRDGGRIAALMRTFRETGRLSVEDARWRSLLSLFAAARFSDEETIETIARLYEEQGILVDPHTAIGIAAGRARRANPSIPLVALATAHPAKFPDAVERASGTRPALPPHLADLYERPERYSELPNDFDALRAHVDAHARLGSGRGGTA